MAVLSCDMGGTRLKVGVIDKGRVLAFEVLDAHAQKGLAHALPQLAKTWRKMLDACGMTLKDCAGVAISFPTIVDVRTARALTHFGKYADAADVDLRAWAKKEFNLPLVVDNDARMALIGEWRHGAGIRTDNLVMLTIGTGLGVCPLIEGRVLRGVHGQAGILGGHLSVHYDGRLCRCGNRGCAEAESATAYLPEMAKARPDFPGSALAKEAVIDFANVFRWAKKGDACALALRAHCMRVWGVLLVSLIHAYDPEKIIVGGGVMRDARVILPALRRHVKKHANTPWGDVKIVASKLGDCAALLAGEWLLREQFPDLKIS